MTTQIFPFNRSDRYAYEVEWSRMAREFTSNGVVDTTPSQDGLPFGDNSGMQVKMRACLWSIQGFWYFTDETKTIAVTANPGGLKRTDRLVLELNMTNKDIVPKVIAGTPSATPAPPPLVQTAPAGSGIWQAPVGLIDVPAGAGAPGNPVQGITAGMVRDDREFADIRLMQFTSTRRRSPGFRIALGWEVDTKRLLYSAGNGTWSVVAEAARSSEQYFSFSPNIGDFAFPISNYVHRPNVGNPVVQGSWDYTGGRVIPRIPGWYQMDICLRYNGTAGTVGNLLLEVRKDSNGSADGGTLAQAGWGPTVYDSSAYDGGPFPSQSTLAFTTRPLYFTGADASHVEIYITGRPGFSIDASPAFCHFTLRRI